MFFQTGELQHFERFPQAPLAGGLILFRVQAAQDVFFHRHMGKQGIVLEQIANLPFLRRQVDAASGIEQRFTVQHDPAFVRLFHAGDTFERHAFAAAGGAQQAGNSVRSLKRSV